MSTYNSLAEFNTALANAKVVLPKLMNVKVRDNAQLLAMNIRNRVSTTGRSMDGSPFTAYSRSHKYKKTKYGNGELGRTIAFKNYFYQGKMWNTFGVKATTNQGDLIVSRINFEGSKKGITHQELNEKHSKDEGKGDEQTFGIAYPNKKEEQALVDAIELAVYELLQEIL